MYISKDEMEKREVATESRGQASPHPLRVFGRRPSFYHWNISSLIKKVMVTHLSHTHTDTVIDSEHSWESLLFQRFYKQGLSGVCVYMSVKTKSFFCVNSTFWEIILQPIADFLEEQGGGVSG